MCHRAEIAVWALCPLVALYQEPLRLQGETHLPVSTCSRCLCPSSTLCGPPSTHAGFLQTLLAGDETVTSDWRMCYCSQQTLIWSSGFRCFYLKITPVQFPRSVQLVSKFLGRIFKQRPTMSLKMSDIKICLFSFEKSILELPQSVTKVSVAFCSNKGSIDQ